MTSARFSRQDVAAPATREEAGDRGGGVLPIGKRCVTASFAELFLNCLHLSEKIY